MNKSFRIKKLKEYFDLPKEEEDEKRNYLCSLLTEELTKLRISHDQNSILIRTNYGTVVVLSSDELKVL